VVTAPAQLTTVGMPFAPPVGCRTGGRTVLPARQREEERTLADYVTVATLVLPPPEGDDRAERLEKAEGLAAAVGAYAEVFVEDPGGDPEVVHRFARMLLALEEFDLACLCPVQRLEREEQIERHRHRVAEENLYPVGKPTSHSTGVGGA